MNLIDRENILPPARTESRLYHFLVWFFLVILVTGYVLLQQSSARIAPDEDAGAGVRILFTGRYVLGFQALQNRFGMENSMTSETLGAQLEEAVGTAADRVAIAILIGELSGPDKARAHLDELEGELRSDVLVEDIRTLRKIYSEGVPAVPEAEGRRLRDHLGWFGDLALVFGMPEDHPQRRAALAPAIRTFAVILAAFAAFSLLFLAAIVLFILALIRISRNQLVATYPRDVAETNPARLPFLETMILFLLSFAILSIIAGFLPPALVWVAYLLPLGTIYWLRFRAVSWHEVRRGLGWYRGTGIMREVLAGLAGYLAGLPLLVVGFLITAFLIRFSGETPVHPVVEQFQDAGPGRLLSIFVLACVAAPFFEETMFRGAFYHYLRCGHRAPFSALFTALVFAVIHPQGFAAIPVLAAIGTVLALIREWRGSLIASITAHACNNSVVMFLVMTMAL